MDELTTGSKLNRFPLENAMHVRDLLWFDGPLLSEYRTKGRALYLCYWCDCGDGIDRWLYVQVRELDVLRLINKKVTLDTLVPSGGLDSWVYVRDTDVEGRTISSYLCESTLLPEVYKPKPNVDLPFEKANASSRSYSVLIQEEWDHRDLNKLNRYFISTCSTVQNFSSDVRVQIDTYPIRTGFAGKHFYDEMERNVPVADKVRLDAISYASPGFIRYAMQADVGLRLAKAVQNVKTTPIASPYSRLNRYFIDNDLNKAEAEVNSEHQFAIGRITRELIDNLGLFNSESLMDVAGSPFQAGKIAVSLVNRLRWLNTAETKGRLLLSR